MDINGLALRMRNEFLDDGRGSVDKDNHWPLPNLYSALVSAEKELARRLLLISDSSSAICRIAIAKVGGVYPQSYPFSDKILRIERLKYPGVIAPLPQKTLDQFDNEYGQGNTEWEGVPGTPSAFSVDLSSGMLTLNRQPIADGVMTLSAKRLPLTGDIASNLLAQSSLEIRQYDDEVIHGALKYAYLKNDPETFDPARSGAWSAIFEKDIKQIQQDKAALNPQPHIMRPERF